MFADATRILKATATRIGDSLDWLDRPSPMRSTISTVALIALNVFAILQNENVLWWGFSFATGWFFHRSILGKDGFSQDMANISWKLLLPSLLIFNSFGWTVNWKVTSVFTGLHAGAKFIEFGLWLNKRTAPPAA